VFRVPCIRDINKVEECVPVRNINSLNALFIYNTYVILIHTTKRALLKPVSSLCN
jgi:hypothetical protein